METLSRPDAGNCRATHQSFSIRRQSRRQIARGAATAQNPAAAKCKSKALAILVFPKVVIAGFVIGAQTGEEVLFVVCKCARAVATGLCAVRERPAP
jgi:lipid-binding SYLF domain-containing protein